MCPQYFSAPWVAFMERERDWSVHEYSPGTVSPPVLVTTTICWQLVIKTLYQYTFHKLWKSIQDYFCYVCSSFSLWILHHVFLIVWTTLIQSMHIVSSILTSAYKTMVCTSVSLPDETFGCSKLNGVYCDVSQCKESCVCFIWHTTLSAVCYEDHNVWNAGRDYRFHSHKFIVRLDCRNIDSEVRE